MSCFSLRIAISAKSIEIGKALDTFGYKAPSDSLSNIDGILHLIITALDWAESDAFSKDIAKLKANKKRFDMFEYLDYAEDEVTDGVSFSTLIDSVLYLRLSSNSISRKSLYIVNFLLTRII